MAALRIRELQQARPVALLEARASGVGLALMSTFAHDFSRFTPLLCLKSTV